MRFLTPLFFPKSVVEKQRGKIGATLFDEITVHHHQRLRRDRRCRSVAVGNGGIRIVEQLKYVVDIVSYDREHVSRVIAKIGKEAKVVVRQADERKKSRVKYASAHDLRRGCALRLINAGVSAETLMVVIRHADFATTQKFYGAMRSAQSAAAEVRHKLSGGDKPPLVGGTEPISHLSESEVQKIKSLLASL